MDLSAIDLLILDVDGVLTAGDVVLRDGEDGARVFNIHDGCRIRLWHRCGGSSAVLSGRQSPVVAQRAVQLGIGTVVQGVSDKLEAYRAILNGLGARDDRVCYVGDDLPDLGPMRCCSFPVAVADAVPTVKQAAQYVTRRRGGRGAVAEVIELILRKQRRWSPVGPANEPRTSVRADAPRGNGVSAPRKSARTEVRGSLDVDRLV